MAINASCRCLKTPPIRDNAFTQSNCRLISNGLSEMTVRDMRLDGASKQ